MNEEALLRRFALALSLVPDANVAADLFMQSTSDAQLQRKAARWLRQNGLPEPNAHAPLPELDYEQREHALHLARRGQKRRRALVVMTGVAVCVFGGAVLSFGSVLDTGRPALADHPAFAGPAIVQSEPVEGLRLSIYRAEAVPGLITVWWELVGRNADEAAESLTFEIDRSAKPIAASEVHAAVHRSNRVLGRATFAVLNPANAVQLLAYRSDDRNIAWRSDTPLTFLAEDPNAQVYIVNEELEIDADRMILERVRVSPHATTVRMRSVGRNNYVPQFISGDKALSRHGAWLPKTQRPGVVEWVLSPVPANAETFTIRYLLGRTSHKEVVYHLPAPGVVTEWERSGDTVTALLQLEPNLLYTPGAQLFDAEGRQYWAPLELVSDGADKSVWRMTASLSDFDQVHGANPRPIVARELTQLQLFIPVALPDPAVTVKLRP